MVAGMVYGRLASMARCGGGATKVNSNSKGLGAKTSNSTRRCRHKFNYAKTKKTMQKAKMAMGSKTLIVFLAFFVVYRYEGGCNLH